VLSGAYIDGQYRYHLWRAWKSAARSVCWVMLNPSTADGMKDDPTIRKCMAFSRAMGFGALDVVNLYALRSTDPAALRAAGFPIGERTDAVVRRVLSEYVDRVIVAWGTKAQEERAGAMLQLIREAGHEPLSLHTTAAGAPGHPLYLRLDSKAGLHLSFPTRPCYAWARQKVA